MKLSKRSYAFLLIMLMAASAMAAPRMIIPESSFDFGFVPQQAKVSHTFWLKSAGTDMLKITKVVPGCGCTKAPLEKADVTVGDSTKLEIIFSTKSYKNQVSKRPKIETNEGEPFKHVSIQTNVVSEPDNTYPIVLKPFVINMTQMAGSTNQFAFQIKNVSDQDLNLKLIDFPADYVSVDLPETVAKNSVARGTVTLNATHAKYNIEKSFTIELNDQNKSRFTLPLIKKPAQLGSK